jgi:hypothetical protein
MTEPSAGAMMDPEATPIADNPGLPSMDAAEAEAEATMASLAATEGTGSGNYMTEPPPSPESGEDNEEYGDMGAPTPRHTRSTAAEPTAGNDDEGYLRLVIDVEHGSLSLVDAAMVAGPLVTTDLSGEMAYDAVVHGRRVAADAFDDLSRSHAFAPPDEDDVGHRVTETDHYQFVARIPRSEVSAAELADLEITLLRTARSSQLSETPQRMAGLPLEEAAAASGEEDPPQVVGRLIGISLDQVPPESARNIEQQLR